jgi:hypothetical protein
MQGRIHIAVLHQEIAQVIVVACTPWLDRHGLTQQTDAKGKLSLLAHKYGKTMQRFGMVRLPLQDQTIASLCLE